MQMNPETPEFPMLSNIIDGADINRLPEAWRSIIQPYLLALQRAQDHPCSYISENPHLNSSTTLFSVIRENGGPDISGFDIADISDIYNGVLATFNNPEYNYRIRFIPAWPAPRLK